MVYARAYTLLVALFFGGTTALSFLAVPMLFAYMDVPQMAGALAARYFAVQQWFAVVGCAFAWVLLAGASRAQLRVLNRRWPTIACWLLAAVVAAVNYFAVSPLIVNARASGGDLAFCHGMGSGLMLIQWIVATVLAWRLLDLADA